MTQPVLVILSRPSANAPAHDRAVAAYRFADPGEPHVSVLDLGVTRGDGVFETISVGHGRAQALEHHLDRFARSASALQLPPPDLDVWRSAIHAAIERLAPGAEAFVKAVYTRGVEGDGRPTGWVLAAHAPDFSAQREHGIRVIMLDRGYRHDVEQTSPWLLAGAKTLSYAINRAVLREAAGRGADDVIFVSADGIVLEGPTSTVVYRRGNTLLTPGTGLGILEGTTQANVFRHAVSLGMPTGFELATPDDLRAADAIWLVSSSRHAAPVRELDGVPREVDTTLTHSINAYLGSLRE